MGLKERFTTAPILVLPDVSRQFVAEVDASDLGVGAVLSQRAADNKMHPCAFFPRRLSPAERNYDIGNRELLAVKLALEEWRQWLEGSQEPFLVWTDHKNLEYLRSAKRMNSRQARWALFFGHFRFTLSYRPGSKNTKPNSLSWTFERGTGVSAPSTIISPALVVGAVSWGVEQWVREAQSKEDTPPSCPDGRLFVPEPVRSEVLQWGHNSKLFCHPGVRRTREAVSQRFWWPSLRPLDIPRRPWSHIALDFVTGLPVSQGHTAILTVVDRFSRCCHFVPLPGLPTARETARLVIHHVFRLHGIPGMWSRTVDHSSRHSFGGSSANPLGATASLSSGYHLQTNGQTEWANQELEKLLRCLCSANPSSWASMLDWVEYAHNSLSSASTGVSLFQGACGYQLPLFEVQEEAVESSSVRAFMRHCQR